MFLPMSSVTDPQVSKSQKLWELPGGIHPQENKLQSLSGPILKAPIPDTLHIPVSQPGFKDVDIVVSEGEVVLKGQVIARGNTSAGVVCHASSSGTVERISEIAIPNNSGIAELCITIKTDGKDQWLESPNTNLDYQNLSHEQFLNIIAEAGISGLGGAGFPTHSKISQHKIHTLIINACECEPFITADDALMREKASDIIQGIKILLHTLKPLKCIIGIEDNKAEALTALKQANDDIRIQIKQVPTKYPSGAEKQLIQILTGEQVPTGGLAVSQGILCQNIATVYAIERAISHGEPLISRITTLSGAALKAPCNMEVLIGTPIPQLLESCGVNHTQLSKLIMGGSLMGISLPELDMPVTKTCACLIATTAEELPPSPPAQACIRCGYCAQACPVSLLPQQLYWFARSKEHEKAEQHNIMDCIECGACAYVCPSHIPLVQYYRASKASIKDERNLHIRAEHSRQRFESRELRIEKNKAEAEIKRKARAELARKNREAKAAKGSDKLDPIQAALARVKAKKEASLLDAKPKNKGDSQ